MAGIENGGNENVAAYLKELDISDFNAKAPPRKTRAWWAIVDAGGAPEDAEFADAIDVLTGKDQPPPQAITIDDMTGRRRATTSANGCKTGGTCGLFHTGWRLVVMWRCVMTQQRTASG